ncbi:unannotated protein [freshwater metagenome]|uniref:Unannotated protein n=1 Tax=freshwater metagenome TaxID=449393 RepID=A0A6J5ZN26_9ZZZZ
MSYTVWGLAPLFWILLAPAKAFEILSHRVIWSLLLLIVLVKWQGRFPHVKAAIAHRKTFALLVVAAVLIACNWGLFIWATMNGHVLDTSLGYYVTPLFSVGLGVIFLKESLRSLQWLALAIAFSGVCYITWEYHRVPWVGLALSSTFALYGYVKKLAGVDAIESLMVESALITPFALVYLAWLSQQGSNTFLQYGVSHALLLASAGVFTAVPLLLYGAAVVRVPLTSIGFMQYISSTIQFFLGIWIFHEPMPFSRLIGFLITWCALAVLTYDGLRNRHGMQPQSVVEFD